MKSLYDFDCESGIAYYRSSGKIVDTRPYGKGSAYILLGWCKNNKHWRDGDVSYPRLHRVVYAIANDIELRSDQVIDHIDNALNDSGLLNNSIHNLRLTNCTGNNRNVSTNTGLNFVKFIKSDNTYGLGLPINNCYQPICRLSANKFSIQDMQQIRNHLVHKHNIDVSTCPPGQDWTPPSPEQLASIVNRTGSKCKLRTYLQCS